jgi:hypothetical protein
VYICCYRDAGTRDLSVFFCSNGTSVYLDYACNDDSRKKCDAGSWAGACDMTPTTCAALCTGVKFFGVQSGYTGGNHFLSS